METSRAKESGLKMLGNGIVRRADIGASVSNHPVFRDVAKIDQMIRW